MQLWSSVDDTVSNLLRHNLFKMVCKLKCQMLYPPSLLPTLYACVSELNLRLQSVAESLTLSLNL